MVMMKNEKLAFLKKKSEKYIIDHHIVFDKIVIPKVEVTKPMFAYFYSEEMQKNEIILESMRNSIINLANTLDAFFK